MLNDLKQAGHGRPMMSVATSMGGRGAANEVLREGLAGALLAEHRMVKEINLLEEAWQRISNNGAVAYGEHILHKAITEGAVETLLIAADLLLRRGGDMQRNGVGSLGRGGRAIRWYDRSMLNRPR